MIDKERLSGIPEDRKEEVVSYPFTKYNSVLLLNIWL